MQSKFTGTCKGPDKHTWDVGDEVFYDKDTKAICIDSKCFQALKGSGGSKADLSNILPRRTPEQKTEDCKSMLEILWPMCFQYADTFLKEKRTDSSFQDIIIFAEVLYKGGAIAWAR